MRDFPQLKVQLKDFCKDKSVFAVILLSAVLVTGVRIATPFRVGKDQALQLEASQRLVKGLGLTTTKAYPRESNDISVAPSSKYLTDWPPGLSLLIAAFLYAGISLLVALKILYATTSLIGWIGWGTIASNLLSRPATYGNTFSWIHLIIVALFPIITTPDWEGSDIFLWAGIPVVLICLHGINKKQPSLLSIAGGGFLFGCLIAIRFTSLFVGLAAALILFQVSYPHIKIFFKRCSVFLFSALLIALPTVIYLQLYAQHVGNAFNGGGVKYSSILIKAILKNLVAVSTLVLGHPLLQLVVFKLNRDWLMYLAGLLCLTVVLTWPVFLWRSANLKGAKANEDLALSFSFLPVSLVLFLVAAALYVGAPQFVQVRRYYEVLSLCGIFIFYEIANRRAALRIVKLASKAVLLSFILYGCVLVPAVAYNNNRRNSVDRNAHGFAKSGMFKLYTPRENSRIKVEQLYRDNPDALFYAHYYQWFTYDRFDRLPTPGISMRALPKPDFWKRAYTSKPVKVFWILDQNATLDFIPGLNQRLVFLDPDEEMKILVSDFSSGPLVSDQIARKTE